MKCTIFSCSKIRNWKLMFWSTSQLNLKRFGFFILFEAHEKMVRSITLTLCETVNPDEESTPFHHIITEILLFQFDFRWPIRCINVSMYYVISIIEFWISFSGSFQCLRLLGDFNQISFDKNVYLLEFYVFMCDFRFYTTILWMFLYLK